MRERARERTTENEEWIDALENEREELEEGTSLKERERVRIIFMKYGFIVSADILTGGTMIIVIVGAFTGGLKSVAKGVGDDFKTLRSEIAAILPCFVC